MEKSGKPELIDIIPKAAIFASILPLMILAGFLLYMTFGMLFQEAPQLGQPSSFADFFSLFLGFVQVGLIIIVATFFISIILLGIFFPSVYLVAKKLKVNFQHWIFILIGAVLGFLSAFFIQIMNLEFLENFLLKLPMLAITGFNEIPGNFWVLAFWGIEGAIVAYAVQRLLKKNGF